MRTRDWDRILAALALAAPTPLVARAETYISEPQAGAAIFPGVRLTPAFIDLTTEQVRRIAKTSGESVRETKVKVWRGPHGETMIIDRVLGKHELITYAVGIEARGRIRGVEILEYQETYGGEIRRAEWRKQFVGKTSSDPLRIDKDIQNISGATLSSVHVTNGVRRVLLTYAAFEGRL